MNLIIFGVGVTISVFLFLGTGEIITVLGFLFFNLVSYWMFWKDKKAATNGKRRVPESMLMLYGLLGGFAGGILSMRRYRHKTRKVSFLIPYYMCAVISALSIITVSALLHNPAWFVQMVH